MAQKKELDAVPEIKIDVELPKLPAGTVLWPFASPFRNAEKEFVLGILTTAAIRHGKWCAIDMPTFAALLRNGPWTMFQQGVINAVWALAEEGYLEIVTVKGKGDYIVPNAKLAETLDNCTLRYA